MFPGKEQQIYSDEEMIGVLKPYDPDMAMRSSNFTSEGPQYAHMLKEDGRYYAHYSFYILPDGSFLDCRQPLDITHLGLTDYMCKHPAEINEFDLNNPKIKLIVEGLKKYFLETKNARGYECLLSKDPEIVKSTVFDFYGFTDSAMLGGENMDDAREATLAAKNRLLERLLTRRPDLAEHKEEVGRLIPEDEVLAHDLGWIKVVIMMDRNYSQMVVRIPNEEMNGKKVTRAQLAVIEQIAKFYGFEPKDVLDDALIRDELITREFTFIKGGKPV